MALIQKSFDSYVINYRCGPDASVPWTGGYRVMINCFLANSYVGGFRFLAEDVTLPSNTATASSIELHFHLSQLRDVLTILQYEKPLFLYCYDDTLVGILGTASEPIGEQEGV